MKNYIILLDNHEIHFDQTYLPILIHGEEGSGASLFTMTLLADLYSQGLRIIALTGFSMARKEFFEQTESQDNAQFFTKEQHNDFISLITSLQNVDEYIILVKNIELFDEELFNTIKNYKNVLLSGNINECAFKEKIFQQYINTKIIFSPLDEQLPPLQTYQGYLTSQSVQGIVSLEA